MTDEEVARLTADAKEAIDYLDEIKAQENARFARLNRTQLKKRLLKDYRKTLARAQNAGMKIIYIGSSHIQHRKKFTHKCQKHFR